MGFVELALEDDGLALSLLLLTLQGFLLLAQTVGKAFLAGFQVSKGVLVLGVFLAFMANFVVVAGGRVRWQPSSPREVSQRGQRASWWEASRSLSLSASCFPSASRRFLGFGQSVWDWTVRSWRRVFSCSRDFSSLERTSRELAVSERRRWSSGALPGGGFQFGLEKADLGVALLFQAGLGLSDSLLEGMDFSVEVVELGAGRR